MGIQSARKSTGIPRPNSNSRQRASTRARRTYTLDSPDAHGSVPGAEVAQTIHTDNLRRSARLKKTQPLKPFPFMDLPRELRDIVYHELWKHTPKILAYLPTEIQEYDDDQDLRDVKFGFYSRGFDSRLTRMYEREYEPNMHSEWESDNEQTDRRYDTVQPLRFEAQYTAYAEGQLTSLPQWLLANHQMLQEGIEQFRLRAQHWVSGVGIIQYGKWPAQSPILDASSAENLTFKGRFLQSHAYMLGTEITVIHLNPWQDRELEVIVRRFHNLKHLRVRFGLIWDVSWELGHGAPVKLDLSRLEDGNLRLNKLEVLVSKGVEYQTTDKDSVLEAFRREIVRVGKVIVKGNGEGRLAFKEKSVRVEDMSMRPGDGWWNDNARCYVPSGRRAARNALSWRFQYTKDNETSSSDQM